MKNASPQLVGTRTDLLELLLQVHGVVVLEDVLGHPAVTDTLQTAFFKKLHRTKQCCGSESFRSGSNILFTLIRIQQK